MDLEIIMPDYRIEFTSDSKNVLQMHLANLIICKSTLLFSQIPKVPLCIPPFRTIGTIVIRSIKCIPVPFRTSCIHIRCVNRHSLIKKKRKREKNTHLLFALAGGWGDRKGAERWVDEKRSSQRDFHEKKRITEKENNKERGKNESNGTIGIDWTNRSNDPRIRGLACFYSLIAFFQRRV